MLISSEASGRCSSAYYKGIFLARDCLSLFADCLGVWVTCLRVSQIVWEFGSLVYDFCPPIWVNSSGSIYHVIVVIVSTQGELSTNLPRYYHGIKPKTPPPLKPPLAKLRRRRKILKPHVEDLKNSNSKPLNLDSRFGKF